MNRQAWIPLCWTLGVIALLGGALQLGHFLASREDSTERPAAPEVAVVDPNPAPDTFTGFPGILMAKNAVDLAPKVEGTLLGYRSAVGARVKAGEVVAVVDVGTLKQELQMAEARLRAVQADRQKSVFDRQNATAALQRDESIAGQLSRAELDRARGQRRAAAAAASAAEARVAEEAARTSQLREMVNGGEMRAPFDGILTEHYLAPGARVGRATPVVRLIGDATLSVKFAVPAEAVSRVSPGTQVAVEMDGTTEMLDGEVETLSAELDPATQTVVAEARLNARQAIPTPSGQGVRIFVSKTHPRYQRR